MIKKEKLYPSLMILGASVLFFRTIRLLMFENGLIILAVWVRVLTIIEMIIDLGCIFLSFRWLITSNKIDKESSLRLGASAAIFHAFRVLIYILGRIGPWKNFDKVDQYRISDDANLFWVYFAGILSIVGVIGVLLINKRIKRSEIER